MNTQEEIIEVLRSAFDSLDYISDKCDELSSSPYNCLDDIKITANGELAELEELINKLNKTKMSKRVIQSGLDTYKFSNSINGDVGMLIEKNGKELGVYPHFEYDKNLDGDYLIELALEFKQDDD